MGFGLFNQTDEPKGLPATHGSTLIVVRHGDKQKGPSLSPKGELRAMKLAYYIRNLSQQMACYPDHIYACQPGEKQEPSIREIQTIGPLTYLISQAGISYKLRHHHRSNEIKAQASEIKTHQKDITFAVVCWEHKELPKLVALLLGWDENRVPAYPDTSYDRVYRIDGYGTENPTLTILDNQYPVFFRGTFQTILDNTLSSLPVKTFLNALMEVPNLLWSTCCWPTGQEEEPPLDENAIVANNLIV